MKPTNASDELFLREAIQLSRAHMLANEGGPFGALVARGDTVVARGWNQVTSGLDPTAHAEVVAIRHACRELRQFSLAGCVLYTSCEPCPMCLAAAYWARLDRVVFAATRDDAAAAGFDDARLYRELTAPIADREMVFQQSLREEAAAVLREWTAQADRVPY